MLITCDKCGKSYQVNEARLPAQGARIKCPKCANVILIRLNNSESSGKSTTVSENDMPSMQLDASLNPGVTQEGSSTSGGSEETWKIRHAGLTYTFHDLSSLQDWLKGRPKLEDVKVAKGEDEWKELGDYAEVMTTQLITKFFPLGDVPKTPKDGAASAPANTSSPTVPQPAPQAAAMNFGVATASKNTMRNVAKSRSEQNKQKQATNNAIKTLIVGIAVVAVILVCLHFVGFSPFSSKQDIPAGYHIEVVDGVETLVSNDVLGTTPEVAPEPKSEAPVAQNDAQSAPVDPETAPEAEPPADSDPSAIDYDEAQKLVDAEIEKRLSMARESVKKRNWPVAQTILLSITADYPDNIEAKELLAKTYRFLGQNEKADALNEEIKALKNL